MSPDEGGGSVVRHFEFYSRPSTAAEGLRGEREQGGGDEAAARAPERRNG